MKAEVEASKRSLLRRKSPAVVPVGLSFDEAQGFGMRRDWPVPN